MNRASLFTLLMLMVSLALTGCNGAQTGKVRGNEPELLKTSFYVVNTKGEDIGVRLLADGKELFSVTVPYKGGIRVPEAGPAIIDGPDAELIRDIEMKADTTSLKVIEENSRMEQSFPNIRSLEIGKGLTIEVKGDHIQLREGIDLPD